MKQRTIVKEAVVLVLATIMIASTFAVANTTTPMAPAPDPSQKPVWIGYAASPTSKGITWLHYDDGVSETAVGSNYPPVFMAIRLTNDELSDYDGSHFIQIQWYHIVYNASIPNHVYDAKIWIGNETRPKTLLLNDTGLAANGQGWINHTLLSPVTINASKDYWIVIKCYSNPAQAMNDYPMPFDTNVSNNISHKSKWWHNSNNHNETDFYEIAGTSPLYGAWLLRIAVDTVDTKPPVTTATLEGNMSGSDYTSDVKVTLKAHDASGIAYTKYKVDGGNWTTYTIPFYVLGNGVHTVGFYSADKLGNVEAQKNTTFTILYPYSFTIKGGLGFNIKVTTTVNLTNLPYEIKVFGKTIDGNITLLAGKSFKYRAIGFGFGKMPIEVTVGEIYKNATGKVILIFVIGVK